MENLIPADIFCTSHNVEYSFIHALHESGLIEVTSLEEINYIPVNELQKLERFILLHYTLDINLEGMETIAHLLEKIDMMQHEMLLLKNRLSLYENI